MLLGLGCISGVGRFEPPIGRQLLHEAIYPQVAQEGAARLDDMLALRAVVPPDAQPLLDARLPAPTGCGGGRGEPEEASGPKRTRGVGG